MIIFPGYTSAREEENYICALSENNNFVANSAQFHLLHLLLKLNHKE